MRIHTVYRANRKRIAKCNKKIIDGITIDLIRLSMYVHCSRTSESTFPWGIVLELWTSRDILLYNLSCAHFLKWTKRWRRVCLTEEGDFVFLSIRVRLCCSHCDCVAIDQNIRARVVNQFICAPSVVRDAFRGFPYTVSSWRLLRIKTTEQLAPTSLAAE